MGFTVINSLPTPTEIREQFPLPENLVEIKKERDEEIKKPTVWQRFRKRQKTA